MTIQKTSIRAALSIAAIGLDGAPVIALAGEEEIGRAPRYEITFAGTEIEAADVVGAEARLFVGERVVGGVIAEIETEEALADGRARSRVTLVPRAWLLSRGRASRTFERLSAPEIIELVVRASGLDLRVETRLREAYPARACTVQHRESDLDFIQRLAERDGIALCFADDTLTLSDHNDALLDAGDLIDAAGVRRKSALLPRRVELVSADPARPELPLSAAETVLETGAGVLEIHDVPFATPEEGARAARLYAEWLRSTATVVHGVRPAPIAAGTRARVAGRAVVVVSVRHVLSPEGVWTSQFTAIPAQTPFRPERRAAAPRVYGLMGGRLSPRAPEGRLRDDEGRYRVREIAGSAERLMPMAGGGAFERELEEGAQVVWSCLDGDPERPVITAVLPDSASPGRAVLRGPNGSMFEVAGNAARSLGEAEGMLDGTGAVPAVAHHADGETTTYTSGAGDDDTWMRFAVPHSDGASWSYVRIGEAATGTSGTISTTNSQSATVTFSESADKCLGLKVNSYDTTGLAGVFDFTDKNRTVLTKGNWEQIVSGKGRLAINDTYEMNVTSERTTIKSDTSKYTWTDGTDMSGFSGFKMSNVIGGTVDTLVGGSFSAQLGFMSSATVGYKLDAVFADSYTYRTGEDLSDCSTLDSRAWNKIQFSIADKPSLFDLGWETPVALLAAGGMATALALGASPADWSSTTTALAYGGALTAALILARATSKEKDLVDGNPILSLDSKNEIAALRSDDWLLMMSPSWVVLGKNQPYETEIGGAVGEKEVAKLKNTNAGTALIIEEGGQLTIQAGKKGFDADGKPSPSQTWAYIWLDRTTVYIKGDQIWIGASDSSKTAEISIKGNVVVDGTLTVKKTLEVTGASTFKDTVTGPNSAVQVKA